MKNLARRSITALHDREKGELFDKNNYKLKTYSFEKDLLKESKAIQEI